MLHYLRYLPLGDLVVRRAWLNLCMILVVIAAVVLLPHFVSFEHRVINILLFVAIFAILALGLNVVVGYTGLLELGYVTFLATGAILTFSLLLIVDTPQGWDSPVGTTDAMPGPHPFNFPGACLLLILASGLVCALIGVVRGIPTLRLTGDYYAIVTLGIAEIVYLVYLNWTSFTGGAYGMKLPINARPTLLGGKLYEDSWQLYYLIMFTLALTIVVMDRLSRSRTGRAWAAIRLDETAARACGINVSKYKMIAFAISGFFGGVGGSLYAMWVGTVATKSLDIWQSILILCAVVLGGMGSIRGVLIGSVVLFSLSELLRESIPFVGRVPQEARWLVYGFLLIFVMRFRPQGLLPRGKGEMRPLSPEEEAELRKAEPRLFVLKESGGQGTTTS
ncbi:MAG: branched-chain amino acid ABC transporter permease [Planctomycetota bacterium]|jgi:branched-chain amino acid transport system permease protein